MKNKKRCTKMKNEKNENDEKGLGIILGGCVITALFGIIATVIQHG